MALRITLASLLICCQGLFAQLKTEVDGIKISFPDISVEHFELRVDSNKVIITPLTNRTIEGQPILFSIPPKNTEVRFRLGFLQYTIDDSPASPLAFVHWTQYHHLRTAAFPFFYETNEGIIKAHELIGFPSKQALAESIFQRNQNTINQQSVYDQETKYVRILHDSSYLECCPEYIKQANEFMKTNKDSLNSLDKLNLEIVYNTIVIRARFQVKGREKEIKIIVKTTRD